ncbi:hypothetical protein GCM10020254_76540 [Streptomyces goshikiensis]
METKAEAQANTVKDTAPAVRAPGGSRLRRDFIRRTLLQATFRCPPKCSALRLLRPGEGTPLRPRRPE